MTQIFHPSTNTFARASIFGAVFIISAILLIWGMWIRSTYATQVGVTRAQPVQFTHEHHVRGLGIDCRYCHTSVETSASAGIPPTSTCMGCHSQIWRESSMLEPVRESFRTGKPLEWTRVHDLPDFVYFDHSIHVAKGVACESCHGRVDKMPLMHKAFSLHMEWCLDCHRNPEKHIRPREDVFTFGYVADHKQDLGAHVFGQERADVATDGNAIPPKTDDKSPEPHADVHKADAPHPHHYLLPTHDVPEMKRHL